ncbi:MAG: HYR domain-containing protein [Flavobacteriales bacterium]|nr:HYR domain-containing protein [Flavobacteriales bacterium]
MKVKDITAPTITCPSDIAVEATAGLCGAVVHLRLPTSSDNCSGATIAQPNGSASGSLFPVGTTP